MVGAGKGSAPLNGKLVSASWLYFEKHFFFRISEAQGRASSLLILPEEQRLNARVGMTLLVLLKQQKMDQHSLLSVQVL